MVDYSSWKEIELSSDEDETHPFIDNATLFRLKHEARLAKMEKRRTEEFALDFRKANYDEKMKKVQDAVKNNGNSASNSSDLENQLLELENEKAIIDQQEEKLKKEKVNWYIDTICHPGFSKSVINDSLLEMNTTSELYVTFVRQNKQYLKQFAILKTFVDSKNFLLLHQQIIKRQSLYYLISYGIKLHLNEEKEKLKTVCCQIVLLLHILELFKMFNRNTEELLVSFFSSINSSDECCRAEFEKECIKIRKHIKHLVINKLNEEKASRIKCKKDENSETSSGCKEDPEYVFNSLPEDLQRCFLNRDKKELAEALSNMPPEQAASYMRKCVNSGLWIPEEIKSDKFLLSK